MRGSQYRVVAFGAQKRKAQAEKQQEVKSKYKLLKNGWLMYDPEIHAGEPASLLS